MGMNKEKLFDAYKFSGAILKNRMVAWRFA